MHFDSSLIATALTDRFEQLALAIGQLPDDLENGLISLGNQIANRLSASGKLLIQANMGPINLGEAVADMLYCNPDFERPPLPAIALNSSSAQIPCHQLNALVAANDFLLVFLSGNDNPEDIEQLVITADSANAAIGIIASEELLKPFENLDCAQLTRLTIPLRSHDHRIYLMLVQSVAFAVPALIEHFLFGKEI